MSEKPFEFTAANGVRWQLQVCSLLQCVQATEADLARALPVEVVRRLAQSRGLCSLENCDPYFLGHIHQLVSCAEVLSLALDGIAEQRDHRAGFAALNQIALGRSRERCDELQGALDAALRKITELRGHVSSLKSIRDGHYRDLKSILREAFGEFPENEASEWLTMLQRKLVELLDERESNVAKNTELLSALDGLEVALQLKQDEIDGLHEELRKTEASRRQLADAALIALASAVCTPAKGYADVPDGASWLSRDIGELRIQRDAAKAEAQSLRGQVEALHVELQRTAAFWNEQCEELRHERDAAVAAQKRAERDDAKDSGRGLSGTSNNPPVREPAAALQAGTYFGPGRDSPGSPLASCKECGGLMSSGLCTNDCCPIGRGEVHDDFLLAAGAIRISERVQPRGISDEFAGALRQAGAREELIESSRAIKPSRSPPLCDGKDYNSGDRERVNPAASTDAVAAYALGQREAAACSSRAPGSREVMQPGESNERDSGDVSAPVAQASSDCTSELAGAIVGK